MTIKEEREKRIFTKISIENAIKEDGRLLIVHSNKVYDVSKFIKYHPGGQLAIRHMVGKDATGAMNAFHSPEILNKKLPSYFIGEYLDEELPTDIDDIIVSKITSDGPNESTASIGQAYLELHDKLRAQGFYKPNVWFYVRRAVFFAAILTASIWTLAQNSDSPINVIASALMMGFFWHGLAFSAHDAGHHALTTNTKWDTYISIFIADFCGGLSIGWWKFNHNTHHIVTNDLEHDPDIQHMPLFAVSSRLFNNLYSTFYDRIMSFDATAKFMISIQHYSFIPVMTFGRFNLYVQSLIYLFRTNADDAPKHRWLELTGIATFWFWYGYLVVYSLIPNFWMKVLFVWLSHAATFILHLQITLSHFAMSTETNSEETFAEKAVRTTMNVDNPQWFDWFHGGLNFQIEHHLFPRLPRVHFRRLQPIVQEFCRKHGLQYHSHGFLKGNGLVLDTLFQVAQQVTFLFASADSQKRFQKSH